MRHALADHLQTKERVLAALEERRGQNNPNYGPRMFRPSYFAGEDVVEVAETTYMAFIKENWLYGRTTYPAIGTFEDEVFETLRQLFAAPGDAGGIFTSGGTESLILSAKIAREHRRAGDRPSGRPNIVLPSTAHPALDKGAELLCLEVRRAPRSDGCVADVGWMADACDEDTILLVGSAPPYPFGQTDPIEALAELAEKRGIWLHVDACLGGMILPFLAEAGRRPPAFDFSVAGVASLLVDLHKFGYATKGISAIMLRDSGAEAHARTVFENWAAGLYATPGIAGTRSGGSVASAWAVMQYLGRSGFVERTRTILDIRDEFITGLRQIGGTVLGRPDCFHFNFVVEGVDARVLCAELASEGWLTSSTERPDSVQLMITAAHRGVAPEFCSDVRTIAGEIRSGKRTGGGAGAVYSKVVVKDRSQDAAQSDCSAR